MTPNESTAAIRPRQRFHSPDQVRRYVTTQREAMPTRRVWRGTGTARELVTTCTDLSDLRIEAFDGTSRTLLGTWTACETDGVLVLHRGQVVHETYRHGFAPSSLHLNASLAKSYMGVMAAVLEHQGLLDRAAAAARYVPRLRGTAFGDAHIGDLLHMSTPVAYGGRPYDRVAETQRFHRVIRPADRPRGYAGPVTIAEHLATAQCAAPAGSAFLYENGNVEAIAAVLRAITGTTTADLLSELLWARIGADEDAYYILDEEGIEMASGGFSATLRDIARVGELLRCEGAIGDRQVIPAAVADSIPSVAPDGPATRVRLPHAPPRSPATLSYHDFWWILNDPFKSFMATGLHGQMLFVSTALDLVIAHYGSHVQSPTTPAPPFMTTFFRIGTYLRTA